jgi:hypothetical protein
MLSAQIWITVGSVASSSESLSDRYDYHNFDSNEKKQWRGEACKFSKFPQGIENINIVNLKVKPY